MPSKRISDIRISPDNQTILKQLGLLQDLAGTWKGKGFNLDRPARLSRLRPTSTCNSIRPAKP